MLGSIHFRIINAEHREDRRLECIDELVQLGIAAQNDTFFKAKFIENYGIRGCALSHAMALSEFLFLDQKPYALILEDDFSIRSPDGFRDTLDALIKLEGHWDVFLLGHNHAIPIGVTPIDDILQVIHSQTASGYLVPRSYAHHLIQSFFRSADLLATFAGLPSPNKELARHQICPDILWKELQIKDRFWAAFPSTIFQRKSYSEIEKRTVDYGV